jgi:hypothetical protein
MIVGLLGLWAGGRHCYLQDWLATVTTKATFFELLHFQLSGVLRNRATVFGGDGSSWLQT